MRIEALANLTEQSDTIIELKNCEITKSLKLLVVVGLKRKEWA